MVVFGTPHVALQAPNWTDTAWVALFTFGGLFRALGAAAASYALPAPDPDRVRVVVGDLRDVEDV